MKEKRLRLGKRTLSIVLSFMMLLSTVLVGDFGAVDATALTDSSILLAGNAEVITLSDGTGTNFSYDTSGKIVLYKAPDGTQTDCYRSIKLKNGSKSAYAFKFYQDGKGWYSVTEHTGIQANSVTPTNISKGGSKNMYLTNGSDDVYGAYRIHYKQASQNQTWLRALYTVTINNGGDNPKGTATFSTYYGDNVDNANPQNTYAEYGETVTVTVSNVEENYTPTVTAVAGVNSSTVSLTNNSGVYTGTYTMTESNVQFNVAYDSGPEEETYTLTSSTSEHGTIGFSSASATEGSSVTVTVTPDTNYKVNTVTFTPTAGSPTTNTVTTSGVYTYSYTMPASNVTVSATYTKTTRTIYYDNTGLIWDKAYVYSTGNELLNANNEYDWPGQEMTYNESLGKYEFELPAAVLNNSSTSKLMFTNNSGQQTGQNTIKSGEGQTYTPYETANIYLAAPSNVKCNGNTWSSNNYTAQPNMKFSQDNTTKQYYIDLTINGAANFRPYRLQTGENTWLFAPDTNGTKYTSSGTTIKRYATSGGKYGSYTGTSGYTYRFIVEPIIAVSASYDIGVTSYINQILTVSKTPPSNGTLTYSIGSTSEPTVANTGDKIKIIATPNVGYRLVNIKVGTTKVPATKLNNGSYQGIYTVKNANVAITAEFEQDQYTNITGEAKYTDDGASWNSAVSSLVGIDPTTWTYNQTVQVTAGNLTNYSFLYWTSTKGTFADSSASPTTFTPNANDAVVSARYAKNYPVNLVQADGGTIAFTDSSKTSYPIGGKIPLTVTETDSYNKILKRLHVTGSYTKGEDEVTVNEYIDVEDKIVNGSYSLAMNYPCAITVTPEFEATPFYTVTLSSQVPSEGTITAVENSGSHTQSGNTIQVTKGKTVQITYTRGSSYYDFLRWDIDGEYAESTNTSFILTNSTITITPKSDLVVVASQNIGNMSGQQYTKPNDSSKPRNIAFGTGDNESSFKIATLYKKDASVATVGAAVIQGSDLPAVGTPCNFVMCSGTNTGNCFNKETYSNNSLTNSAVVHNNFDVTSADENLIRIDYAVTEYRTSESTTYDIQHYSTFTILSDTVTAVVIEHYAIEAGEGYKFVVVPITDNITTTGSAVTVYAKNGTVRNDETTGNMRPYDYFSRIGTTKVYNYYTKAECSYQTESGITTEYKGVQRAKKVSVNKGDSILVKTTIPEAYKNSIYVKAFSVNGVSYGVIDEDTANTKKSSGEYSFVLPIDSNTTETTFEITPIYFYFHTVDNDYITFYIEDFDKGAEAEWGETLACYAWYGEDNILDVEALGGFPGQPVVNYGGMRYIQIPRTYNGRYITGVTLNNYVHDLVHATINEYTGDNEKSLNNHQTYDYDDFVKLAKIDDVDTITYRFKYKTATNNVPKSVADMTYPSDSKCNYPDYYDLNETMTYNYTSNDSTTYGSATSYVPSGVKNTGNAPVKQTAARANIGNDGSFEDYLNYSGDKHIDLFNHTLTDAQVTDKAGSEYYIVSDGYMNVYFGYFGTLWSVYKKSGSTYTYKGTLPSSAFYFDLEEYNTTSQKFEIKSEYSAYTTNNNTKLNLATVPGDFIDSNDKLKNEVAGYWKTYATLYNEATYVPVKICYEDAIYSAYPGSETLAAWSIPTRTADPGERCDGRWFYSRKSDVITAKITIKYKPIGQSDYLTETTSVSGAAKYTGAVTKAKAYFTDAGTGTNNGVVSYYKNTNDTGNVTKNSLTSFEIEADELAYPSGDAANSETVYVFQGWVIDNNGTEISVDPQNVLSTTGSQKKTRDYSFVAKYVEVTNEQLEVTHSLLNTLTQEQGFVENNIQDSGNNVITPHDANGNTYVKIELVDPDVYAVVKTLTANNVSQAQISSLDLREYALDGYKMRLTLTASRVNNDTNKLKYGGLYNSYNSKYYAPTEATMIPAKSSDGSASGENGWNSSEYVYNFDVSSLFTDSNYTTLRTNNIDMFSDIIRTIQVIFKYYDREVDSYNSASNVSSTASEIVYDDYEVPYQSSIKLLSQAMSAKITNEPINNIVDEVVFHYSQYDAVENIKNVKFYAKSEDKSFVTHENEKYSDFIKGEDAAKLAYHTDKYGRPQNLTIDGVQACEATDNENWVTFYTDYSKTGTKTPNTIANTASAAYSAQNSTEATLGGVKAVVIWGYNYPRPYTLTANFTPEYTNNIANVPVLTHSVTVYEDKTFTSTSNNTTTVIMPDNREAAQKIIYIDEGNTVDSIQGFYNQRVGSDSAVGGDTSTYLNNYGITSPFFGGSEKEIKATENAKSNAQLESADLVFDGWYIQDSNGYHKVSSDRSYQNRVTATTTIYAGYVSSNTEPTKLENLGVAITQNATDYYVDENDVSKVRFNTELNVYGADDDDDHIKNVAVIYFKLPEKSNGEDWTTAEKQALLDYYNIDTTEGYTHYEALKERIKKHINFVDTQYIDDDTYAFKTGKLKYYHTTSTYAVNITNMTFDENGKINVFAYQVVTANASEATHSVDLTNKNRIQFTLTMDLDDYNARPFLVFAAINYVYDDDENNENDVDQWLISDNFVSNIPQSSGSAGDPDDQGDEEEGEDQGEEEQPKGIPEIAE